MTQKNKQKEEEVKVPEKFQGIVQSIEQMSVLDLNELVKILENKFGVIAQPQVAAGPGARAEEGPEPSPKEKSTYDVVLKEVGEKKIDVIKAVRDVTDKGLKDAKALVDAVREGAQEIKKAVDKEEAQSIKKRFEEVGAVVELK